MSRELKRVPPDFDHPIEWPNLWPGYMRNCDDEDCYGCEDCDRIDPPTGEGFQLWESTSEGSPISPVFPSAEDLAEWMSENDCLFAGTRPSRETALTWLLGSGQSVSMVIDSSGQVMDGVTASVTLWNGR